MLTLAQFLADAPVPMLPEGGVFERFVLESPWLLAITLLVVAVAMAALLLKRGDGRRGALLGGGIALVGVVVVLIGTLVTTERERLQARTLGLVGLTVRAQTSELAGYLDEKVAFSGIAGVGAIAGREALLEQVRNYPGAAYTIRSHSTSSVGVSIDGENVARTQVRVWVRLDKDVAMYDAAIGSWWRLDWRRDPVAGSPPGTYGPWRVSRITMMQLDGVGVHPEFAR